MMIKLNDVLKKIDSLEKQIKEKNNIVELSVYSDGSGYIGSSDYCYFDFGRLSDLKTFSEMSVPYIIANRRKIK